MGKHKVRRIRKNQRYKKKILIKGSSGYILKKIPENALKQTLELVNNPTDYINNWYGKNNSCISMITNFQEYVEDGQLKTSPYYKMKYMRQCLLRRDWRNLARILSMINTRNGRTNAGLYPIFLKYAVMCLAHNNTNSLDTLIKSCASLDTPEEMLKKCTKIRVEDIETIEDENFKKIKIDVEENDDEENNVEGNNVEENNVEENNVEENNVEDNDDNENCYKDIVDIFNLL